MATRCFRPLLSCAGQASSRPSSPTIVRRSRALTRLPLRHAHQIERDHDVFGCRQHRKQIVGLKDEAKVLKAPRAALILVQPLHRDVMQ
jgi:hypothetical protein